MGSPGTVPARRRASAARSARCSSGVGSGGAAAGYPSGKSARLAADTVPAMRAGAKTCVRRRYGRRLGVCGGQRARCGAVRCGAVWAGTHRSRNGPQAAASMLRRARRAAPAKRSRREKSVARRASGARARSWGCCGDGRGASGDGEGCGEGAEEEYGKRDGGGDGERGGRGACEVDSGEVQKAGVGDGLDRGGTEGCSGGGGGGGEEGKEREPGAA